MGERAARRRFTREFKLEAIRQVVGEGRTQKAVAEELGVNANLLGRWIKRICWLMLHKTRYSPSCFQQFREGTLGNRSIPIVVRSQP